MVQKYYNVAETAEMLGVSPEAVKQMLTDHELRGYRDGADWKFKTEDVEAKIRERSSRPAEPPDDEGDVLLSEIELGESDPGASGTVIGMDHAGLAGESDILLGGREPEDEASRPSDVSQFEHLDLAIDDGISLDAGEAQAGPASPEGDSSINLAGDDLDDDDLVLGGSGTGSDITIGGDSGISLVDPADSGLSLEEPLDLGGGDESLELGEDDMIAITEDDALEEVADTAELETDDDFLLTPLEEAADGDDSESGSQVIALDTEDEAEEVPAMVADVGGMAAMLDEDLSGASADLGVTTAIDAGALGAQRGGMADAARVQPGGAALPEAPYSGLNITSLAICAFLLIVCGMFSYDLLRNMWSWGEPYSASSALMDPLVKLFD
jgi:excisionase family DNA binding protein